MICLLKNADSDIPFLLRVDGTMDDLNRFYYRCRCVSISKQGKQRLIQQSKQRLIVVSHLPLPRSGDISEFVWDLHVTKPPYVISSQSADVARECVPAFSRLRNIPFLFQKGLGGDTVFSRHVVPLHASGSFVVHLLPRMNEATGDVDRESNIRR